ncbi:uncharacterized protein [Castor canadensis]|uniref:Uncharacterized protein n=1 Tax=Castor canadensis TaxID=51338 RepID=A0AC58KDV1_CASCN
MGRVCAHIKEQELTQRMDVTTHLGRLGLRCNALPPPTAAGSGQLKAWEKALVPTPFLSGKQPKSKPRKAAVELMEPEITAPPSPPGSVGGHGKQGHDVSDVRYTGLGRESSGIWLPSLAGLLLWQQGARTPKLGALLSTFPTVSPAPHALQALLQDTVTSHS